MLVYQMAAGEECRDRGCSLQALKLRMTAAIITFYSLTTSNVNFLRRVMLLQTSAAVRIGLLLALLVLGLWTGH